jgi:hypothetical protein
MDLPPNFHPHTGVASSNASIASSTTISTLRDSQTDYFGLGKPGVAGEERFRSLTDLKWGEFETMALGDWNQAKRNSSLTSRKVPGQYALVFPVSCCSC